jgi:UDP-glucose 4-epimerase
VRIAVTGGSGFVGSHLVDRLASEGHDVLVLDDAPPHRRDVEARPVDVRDLDGLVEALAGCGAVFHLAAVSDVNVAFDHPLDTLAVNVTGTANVWEAARRNGVGRALLASTVWVYGAAKGPGPYDEGTPLDPSAAGHIYTASKIAAEMVAQEYRRLYGQKFTILRYGIPFGPRMREALVIPRFVRTALDGGTITINGDGAQFRAYVEIDDLIEAHILALGTAAEDEVLNLEGLEPVSIRDLAEHVRAIVGPQVAVEHLPARPGDFAGEAVSADKAWQLLGWRPEISFVDGLRRYVDWYRLQHAEPPGPW